MNYIEIIDNLIKTEQDLGENSVFSENYINQLKRRKKIYLRGFEDGQK